MEEEVVIVSTLDNSQTIEALVESEKQVNKNAESFEEATKASTDLMKGIVKDSKKAQKTLKELTDQSEELSEKILTTKRGTAAYEDLRQELIQVNKEIKNVELSFEALDSEQVASEVGSVVGGLTDVATGSFLALGVAEESAQEFFQTLAQVEGTGRIVKGSIEGIQSATKLYNNVIKSGKALQIANAASTAAMTAAQTAYTTAVGASTGGLKLFRLALIGTGIGAIVVGLGLLIANFDSISDSVKEAINDFDNMGTVIQVILYPITLLIEAWEMVQKVLQDLGIIENEEMKAAIKNAEDRVEATKKEETAIGEKFDFEIAKANAAGKDTIEIEKAKREAVIQNLKAQAEAILTLVKLTGEFNDDQREALQELTDKAKKLKQEETISFIEETKKKSDAAKKAAEEAEKEEEKRREKEEKEAKEEADKLVKIANELSKLRIDSIEDETERELALLDERFDSRIEKLKAGGEAEIELALALEKDKARKIQAVNDKAAEEKLAKEAEMEALKREKEAILFETDQAIRESRATTEAEKLEAERALALENEQIAFEERLVKLEERGLLTNELEAQIEDARLASLAQINTSYDEARQVQEEDNKKKEIARDEQKRDAKIAIAANTANALGSIAGSLDQLGIKSSKLAKTVAIAQIAINTAEGISAAVKAGAGVPFPGNIPAILSGTAAVLSGIVSAKAALSSAKIPGGGGGSGGLSLPSPNISSAANAAAIEPLEPFNPTGESTGEDEGEGSNEAGSNQVIKAFVVEEEISDAQAQARVIEEKSELT